MTSTTCSPDRPCAEVLQRLEPGELVVTVDESESDDDDAGLESRLPEDDVDAEARPMDEDEWRDGVCGGT